jgi:hypothetical protein
MPQETPTWEEFQALKNTVEDQAVQIQDLAARVTDLEADNPPDVPPEPISPPDGDDVLTAVVTLGATPYHLGGVYTYSEVNGVVQDPYSDPRGQFMITITRVINPDCPLEVYFNRVYDTANSGCEHVYVEFYWGDPSVCDASKGYGGFVKNNIDLGAYTVQVSGDFVMTGATTKHWRFARWRLCSWGAPENWPIALTPVDLLIAENLVCAYDPALPGDSVCIDNPGAQGSPYKPYEPMSWAGLRVDWGSTGEDGTIGLMPDQAAYYLAKRDSQSLNILANLTEAFSSYPLYFRDPATGALLNCVGSATAPGNSGNRQYYGWWADGSSSHRPTLARASTLWNCKFDGPQGVVLPAGMQITDSNGAVWRLNNGPKTIDDSGTWTQAQVTSATSDSPVFPPNNTATTSFKDTTGNPLPLQGVTFTFLTANGYEGADGFNPTMNHANNTPYVYALLTRDPYHIKSVQAIADYWDAGTGLPYDGIAWGKQNNDGTSWAGFNEIRGQAWKVRDLAQAVLVTPLDAPSWLLPKAEFAYCLEQHRLAYLYRYDNPWNPTFQAWNTMLNSLAGDNYLRNNGSHAFYQEDYMLLALARALVAEPAWLDVANKLLSPRIAMLKDGGWCSAIMTMYGNPGYWAKGPVTGGKATGALFVSWREAWTDPGTGWLKQLSGQYPTPPLDPCPEHIVYPGGNYVSYNCTFYAAVAALKQLGMCGEIGGFDDLAEYVCSEMRGKFSAGTKPAWRQCAF